MNYQCNPNLKKRTIINFPNSSIIQRVHPTGILLRVFTDVTLRSLWTFDGTFYRLQVSLSLGRWPNRVIGLSVYKFYLDRHPQLVGWATLLHVVLEKRAGKVALQKSLKVRCISISTVKFLVQFVKPIFENIQSWALEVLWKTTF